MTRWQLILRNLLLHIQRAPTDMQSAKVLVALLVLLVYFAYVAWSIYYLGPWGALCAALMLFLAFGLVRLIVNSHRADDALLFSLSPDRPELSESTNDDVGLSTLRRMLYQNAILADRAAAEVLLRIGALQNLTPGASPRRTLDFAKSIGIWDSFESNEKDLLLSQEGSWDPSAADEGFLRLEDTRTLRWVLKVDDLLVPFEFADFHLDSALEITSGASAPELHALDVADIRLSRNLATLYVRRGLAEGVKRGLYQFDDVTERNALLAVADAMRERPSDDLLADTQKFHQTSDARIRTLTQIALRRAQTLDTVIQVLERTQSAIQEERV